MEKHFFRRSMVVLFTTCMVGTTLSACGKTPVSKMVDKATRKTSEATLSCSERVCDKDLSEFKSMFTVTVHKKGKEENIPNSDIISIVKKSERDDGITYIATAKVNGKKVTTSELVVPKRAPIYAGYKDNTLYFAATEQEIKNVGVVDGRFNYGDVSFFSLTPWEPECKNITKINVLSEIKPTVCDYWFSHFSHLTEIENINNFNTKNVYDMHGMFDGCVNLTSLDLSSFDTGNVTDMEDMFNGCTSLCSLNISNFNTSNVINMKGLFANCNSLTTLNLSNFDTSNAMYMQNMFYYCESLTSLDVTHFDTSKVLDMNHMFFKCSSLKALDVSNFVTNSVACMASMFESCESLSELDLSNFDTDKVNSMNCMFDCCHGLKSLNLGKFETKNLDFPPTFFECSKDLKIYTTSEKAKEALLEVYTDKGLTDEDIIVGSSK